VQNVSRAIFEEFLALLKEHRGPFLRKICGEVSQRIHHLLLRDEIQSRSARIELKVGQLEREPFDSPALLKVCNLVRSRVGPEGEDAEDEDSDDEDVEDEVATDKEGENVELL
jgi:hypothetical protein